MSYRGYLPTAHLTPKYKLQTALGKNRTFIIPRQTRQDRTVVDCRANSFHLSFVFAGSKQVPWKIVPVVYSMWMVMVLMVRWGGFDLVLFCWTVEFRSRSVTNLNWVSIIDEFFGWIGFRGTWLTRLSRWKISMLQMPRIASFEYLIFCIMESEDFYLVIWNEYISRIIVS